MWKKIVVAILTFVTASAMAAEVKIFDKVKFEDIKPQLEAEGKLDKDGRFPTIVLGQAVALFIKSETGIPTEGVAEKWQKYYNVPLTMDGREFNKASKELGIDDTFVASLRGDTPAVKTAAKAADAPKPPMVAQATPVQTPAVKPAAIEPVKPTDSSIDLAIKDLTKKVEMLEGRGDASAKALKAELATIATQSATMAAKSQYEEVAGKLNNISALVSKAAESAEKAEKAAKVAIENAAGAKASAGDASTFAKTAGEKADEATKSATSAKDSAEEAVKASQATAEAADAVQAGLKTVNGMVQNAYLIYGALALGALALLVAIMRKRGGSLDMKEVKKVVEVEVKEAVAVQTGGLNDRVARAEARANKALDKAIKLAEGIQVVEFDDDFKSGIFDLQLDAKVFFWKAVLMGKADGVMLAFESEEPGYVLIHGIEGQTKRVRLSEGALKGVIGRATKLDEEGKCRLVGLSEDEVDALKKRLLSEATVGFASTVSDQPDTIPAGIDDGPAAKLEAWAREGGLSKEVVAQYVADQETARAKAGKPASAQPTTAAA